MAAQTVQPAPRAGNGLSRKFPAEYHSWKAMWARCTKPSNPSYPKYGKAGVTVCDRWRDFAAFLEDMGQKPTWAHQIERRKNALGYSPENCRWATPAEQQRNTSKCVWITYEGRTQCLADWANEKDIPVATLSWRLHHGYSAERALTAPAFSRPGRQRRFLTAWGLTLSATAWARWIGRKPDTLWDRVHKHGWTPEDAIGVPTRKRGRPKGGSVAVPPKTVAVCPENSTRHLHLPFSDPAANLDSVTPSVASGVSGGVAQWSEQRLHNVPTSDDGQTTTPKHQPAQ